VLGLYMAFGTNYLPNKKNASKKAKPNIILFTMDSVRKKNMNVYGYSRHNTPFFNKFAKSSYVFQNMESCSNLTYVCLPAILNGRYPKRPDEMKNTERTDHLISALRENGYKETIYMSQLFNFERNAFTEYINISSDKNSLNSLHLKQINKNIAWLMNYLSQDERYFLLWSIIDPRNIDYNKIQPDMDIYMSYLADKLAGCNEPAFVWIHLMQAHHPFEFPLYMKGTYKGSPVRFIDLYDTSILYLDYIFEKLNIELASHGLQDNTIIAVSADHGYSFPNDLPYRGPFQATSMTNGTFNIPFILHLPGQKKRVDVNTIVSQIDIAPTLLELTGCKIPEKIEGESLCQYMNEPDKMSDKVKFSILAQYFLKRDSNSQMGKWADDDFANAFYDRYMTQLSIANPSANRFTEEDLKAMIVGPDFSDVGDGHPPGMAPGTPGQFRPKPPPFPEGIPFLKYKCYGVYDIISDPDFKMNLRDTETGRKVLDVLKDSGIVNYYKEIRN
ncbi:MAG: sulfatase-like hydrolase/transferase, partial [Firmicutes bacterium]|nr:sulfatase-like hydrolase/transferase [Bacillota bacterium]